MVVKHKKWSYGGMNSAPPVTTLALLPQTAVALDACCQLLAATKVSWQRELEMAGMDEQGGEREEWVSFWAGKGAVRRCNGKGRGGS